VDTGGGGGNSPAANQQNDCQRFANIVDNIARNSANVKDFMQAMINRFIGSTQNLSAESGQDLERARNIGNNEFRDSGFKSQFKDKSNQVRHFTAGLWAGYLYGPGISMLGMNTNEANSLGTGTGVIRSGGGILPWLFPTPGSEGSAADIALNSVSTALGANLIPIAEEIRDVGDRGGWRRIPAHPGYKGLADAIRKQVCE